MVKYWLLFAFTAQVIFLASSTGNVQRGYRSSRSNSRSSSNSQSHTSSYQDSGVGPCSHGHAYQQESSSSSTSSSSSSSSSIGFITQPRQHPNCKSCRKNEIWVPCPEAVCAPKTCKDVRHPIPCYDLRPNEKCPSQPGCICREGFVRNHKGICIPIENCHPRICKKLNEVYDPCPAPCPFRTCGINDAAVSCVPALPIGHPDCAPPKCRCRDGFYRNDVGDCVRWEDCPICENPNEIYDPCPAPCPPQNCGVDEALILCAVPPQLGDPKCEPGCRCIDGFVRNYTKICIPKDQCPKCTRPNEVYDPCIAPCPPRRCDVDERLIKCGQPPKLGSPLCKAGCRCADGYSKNDEGICIPKEQCPQYCGPNERYEECPPFLCQATNCSQVGFPIPCPGFAGPDCPGEPACVCQEDYVRDENGVCIPKYQCPSCKGDSKAVSGCGVYCNQRCRDIGKKPGPCILICYPNSCDCREGYYLDENTGFCVLPEDCSPQCPENEFYSECIQGNCSPQNCSQLGFPISCPRINTEYCKKGCLCKGGFVRNDKGVCVPSTECPSCEGDPNKKAGCGVYCNQRCRDVGKEPGACIDVCYENACDCREGTYLDENTGFCVPPKDCTPQCPVNEFYSECIQGNCSPQNCSQLGYPIPCPDINPKYCEKGCLCKEGFLRNDKGVCVPSTECPSCEGDPNKKAGCGVYCNQRCRDVGKEPGACIYICYENACDCREGTYLDENTGFCVPPKDCTPQCPENEFYSECTQGNCSPQNCSQLGFPIPCPDINPEYCKKGCLCKEGFLRNDKGVCVPSTECPSCQGDPNKKAGCGVYCNQRCTDVGKEPGACIYICYENACDCREGTYLDENTGFCVPPKDCTPQCPENEFYSECTQGNCSTQNCSQLGFPIPCPDINPEYCKKGCLCKEGFLRNDKGVCVPSTECPSCEGDPNKKAGCGVYCNQRCRDVGKEPGACIEVCYENACDCREGTYLDENTGFCVPPEDCTPQCPINEFYSECIQGNCSPQNCSQLGFPISCPRIDTEYCKKGCLCKEGFVRNDKGICIRATECPSCGGDTNKISGCGVYCNQRCQDVGKEPGPCIAICNENACDCREGTFLDKNTGFCVPAKDCTPQCPDNERYDECIQGQCSPKNCSQVGFPVPCPRIDKKYCKKGCICEEGYARNENGICIPLKECPSCRGDPNAEAGCGGYCNRRCSDIGKETRFCTLICEINGCDCKEGYYFDDNTGKCVKPEECSTPVCFEVNNEVYSDCINGGCQAKNCSQYDKPVPCPKINYKDCIKGCLCKEGYLRASNGKCIMAKDCPEACNGPFEEYNECSWNCPPQTCESLDRSYVCPIKEGDNCKPMCRCKPGYYRNKIGQCITEEECRRCMGLHEYYSCGGACDNVCETLDEQSQNNCPIVNIKCNEMCYCEEGYARAKNNTCIPISCCDEPQCPINERYERNPEASCEPQYCSQLGFSPCPTSGADGQNQSQPGCVCIDGFVRDEYGRCIPKRDCPSCGGDPNAQSGCGVNCEKRCRDLIGKPSACIEICFNNACDCKDGFYYDSKQNRCVSPGQCTNICGQNEVFEDCSNPICRPKNCTDLGFPLDCNSPCIKECVCKDGYVRDRKGRCIPVKQCPSCGGDPNAESGCGVNCGQRCSDIGKGPQPCLRICKINSCDCKKGYYYDSNTKKCVKSEDCSPICLEENNEVYSDCINGGCFPKNCSQLGIEIPCAKLDSKSCIGGCLCKEGYLRAANGKCIPQKDCPEACKGPNEEYNECSFDCPPQTCESLDRAYVCPIREGEDCKPMCKCKPGYFRNKIGQCITEEQCRRCMGLHEFFSCGGACDNVCKTLHKQNQTNCPIINVKCNDMCYCEENYARAKNNTCIPIINCNEPQCPINERYEPCPGASCEPQYCSQLGYPVPCPLFPEDRQCPKKPGCVCIDGYVRNDSGKCIPKKDCDSCGGDTNAQSGCGVNCGKRCRDLGKDNVPCIKVCYPNACDCKDGYYYDSKQNRCVLPGQCTDICGENEVFEDCSDPICRVKNCTQLGFPLNCDSECLKGCICQEGFARNSKGKCIPVKECPSCGGDYNAESGCGVNCLKKCYDLQNPDRPRPCPRICHVNACDCREGYYFDENTNQCVLPDNCSPSCGKNEIYSSCANGGCEMKNCSQLGKLQLCIDPIECLEGCICKKGFLRLRNGTCVPYDQCPIPKCRKHERFELCPAKLCQPQNCRDIGFPIDCPATNDTCPGYPACVCDYGYVRNNKGICRPKEECPSCGGDLNARAGCGINCNKRCPNNYLNPKLCPRICLPNACDCKDGFYYDINTKSCVKFEECSPRCDELNNEEYDSCANGGCGWRNCSQVGGPILCIDPIACKKGCKCRKDYYRLNNGTCVPKDKCPLNCWKPNEVYDPCPSKCSPQTCESINQKYFCPKQNASDCVGQCRCKPNFYRNKIGECICKEDCLKCTGPNEYFSCGPACDNVCSKLDTESKDNCPIKNIKCVPRCYCVDGFARNDKGICIPIHQCPGRQASTSTTTTQKPTTKPNPPTNATTAIANFERGNQALAGEFLYQLLVTRPGENFMISGFSVLVAMAQLANNAVGIASEQLLRLLNLKNKDEIRTVFPILIENYKTQREIQFELAVKYYSSINYPFSDEFVGESKAIFDSEVQSLDFTKNEAAANTINKWVEDKTKGLIKNLVNADMFNQDTRCVLANVLYFFGNWEKQFNKNNTKPRNFYIDDKNSVLRDTMYQEGRFGYAESNDLDCKILQLLYKGGNFSLIVYLPNKRTGIESMAEKLRNPDIFASSLTLLKRENVEVYLPVMEFDSDISNLPDLLKKVNLTEPFKQGSDNFKGILQNEEPLFISDAIQKTKIKVDETGTEAAAATAVILMTRALARPPTEKYIFDANHPFAFYLMLNNFVMFEGCFVQ